MRSALLIAVVVVFGGTGCSGKPSQPPGGARGSKADAARKEAEAFAVGGAVSAASEVKSREESRRGGTGIVAKLSLVPGAAEVIAAARIAAQAPPKPPPVPPVPPVTRSPASEPARFSPRAPVREVVSNQLPTTNESEAESDFFAVAQDVIERRLADLDPPVRYRPTANEVKNEFLRRDTRYSEKLAKVTGDEARSRRAGSIRDVAEALHLPSEQIEGLQYVEYTIEVTAEQVRELRTRDRLADGLRGLGLVTAAAVAGLLFLRLDQWTRGHLTRLLAIAAVALAVAAAVALYVL